MTGGHNEGASGSSSLGGLPVHSECYRPLVLFACPAQPEFVDGADHKSVGGSSERNSVQKTFGSINALDFIKA